MIDTGSRMIRLGNGRVRVLRPQVSRAGIWLFQYDAYIGPGTCRRCGCTDLFGCPGGCHWVDTRQQLCSRCAERIAR